MNTDDMQAIVSDQLGKLRAWSYADLAARVDQDRRSHECLASIEGTAADGTHYFIECQAFWDDKPNADVRVTADLWTLPQKPLLGFLPVYPSEFHDSFIMNPRCQFVGEDD